MEKLKYNNVFDSITDDKKEAKELKAKSDALLRLRDQIGGKNWHPSYLRRALSVLISVAENLAYGHISRFTLADIQQYVNKTREGATPLWAAWTIWR